MKARISLVLKASRPISAVWRSRLRAYKLQRSLEYFGLILAFSVAGTWLSYWCLSTISAWVPVMAWPIFAWTVDVTMTLDAVCVMLCALSLFAYALSAIQAWLPFWASILTTGAIATLAIRGVIDVKLWLLQQGARLYPSDLRAEYLEWVAHLQHILVWVVTAGT